MHKAKELYGHRVCRKCYYGFANRRQAAYLLDALVWGIGTAVVAGVVVFGLMMNSTSPQGPGTTGGGTALDSELMFILGAGVAGLLMNAIFACKDGFNGHSPFKAAFGVQTITADTHEPIGFGRSFKRNLPHLAIIMGVSYVPFAGGLISLIVYLVVASQLCKGPRIGDGWANTKVIWKKYAHHPIFSNSGMCNGCGYDLQGTVGVSCPECGFAIDAAKRSRLNQNLGNPDLAEPIPRGNDAL